MTEATTPIRKSSLPCTPPPEWEFHTWFPHPDGGGDMVPGERQRGVLVRRRVSYGDWEPVRPDRWADEPPTDASSAGVVQLPPTNQTALRDRITEALEHGPVRCPLSPCPVVMHTPDGARAHLTNAHPGPVLPAPVDRATVLREEAALIRAHCPDHLDDNSAEGSWMNCHCDVADDMERRAAAAEARATEEQPLRCAAAVLNRPHGPHRWEPQPGMDPVRCPGACRCKHPEDEHSVYGCADGCACEYLPARPAVVQPAQPHNDETQQDGAQS